MAAIRFKAENGLEITINEACVAHVHPDRDPNKCHLTIIGGEKFKVGFSRDAMLELLGWEVTDAAPANPAASERDTAPAPKKVRKPRKKATDGRIKTAEVKIATESGMNA